MSCHSRGFSESKFSVLHGVYLLCGGKECADVICIICIVPSKFDVMWKIEIEGSTLFHFCHVSMTIITIIWFTLNCSAVLLLLSSKK
jgi:hypothetical protein